LYIVPLSDGSLYGGLMLGGTIVDGATIEAQRIWCSGRVADFDSVAVIEARIASLVALWVMCRGI
jgi:hypothetical protein